MINQNMKGLTLIELLVTIAISGIIIAGAYHFFDRHNKLVAIQEENSYMFQELQTASAWISEGLRMCGYTLQGTSGFGFAHRAGTGAPDYGRSTNTTAIYCTLDWNNDGIITENGTGSSFDHVGFRLNVANDGSAKATPDYVLRRYDTGIVHWQPLCTNIAEVNFTYLDDNGAQILDPEHNLESITCIKIQITAMPSPQRSGLGIGNRTMSTTVWCRNLQRQ